MIRSLVLRVSLCLVSTVALTSPSTNLLAQHHGGGHRGSGHVGGGHVGGGNIGGGAARLGGPSYAGGRGGNFASGSSFAGSNYSRGYGGIYGSGYRTGGYPRSGSYGGITIGLGSLGLGYSNLGFSNFGYGSGFGYGYGNDGLGYSNGYYSRYPSSYSRYGSYYGTGNSYFPYDQQPNYGYSTTNPNYYGRATNRLAVGVGGLTDPTVPQQVPQTSANNSDLRPGMVLPDGAIVISVDPVK